MKCFSIPFISMGFLFLLGCSPVKLPATNEYQISAYSAKQLVTKPQHNTLLVTAPEAVAGYDTKEMLYIKKPFKLEVFAKNTWAAAPAEMFYPLLVQSVQRSGFFYAVTSSPYVQEADYRLDSQLLHLEQSFLHQPSVLQLSVKVVLTHVSDSKVIASQIINRQIPCPTDTPYGGVVAANQASEQITAAVAAFVLASIKHD